MQLAVQADELQASGSTVETILPDSSSFDAFGGNMMDLSTRPAAARAAYEQGKDLGGQRSEVQGAGCASNQASTCCAWVFGGKIG